MSATSGTVALANTTTRLECKTAADCAADARIVDLVGYGTAVRETSPAPTLNTTAAFRPTLTDTDDNSADFTAGAPTPDAEPPPPPPLLKIHEIQGDEHPPPLDATAVRRGRCRHCRAALDPLGASGCRTSAPDEAATSEGIFVFSGSTSPNVQPGDAVHGQRAPSTSSSTLRSGELRDAVDHRTRRRDLGDAVDRQPLASAEVLAPATVPVTYTREPGYLIETGDLQSSQNALDFFESREGMRVQVSDARVVGPTTAFNEFFNHEAQPEPDGSGRHALQRLRPAEQRATWSSR